MEETVLQFWEVGDAPENLRRLIPSVPTRGWLALIPPGGAEGLVEGLVSRYNSLGFPVSQYKSGDGAIVLVGPHLFSSSPARFPCAIV